MPLRCSAAELQPQESLVPSPGTAPGSREFQSRAFLIKLRRRLWLAERARIELVLVDRQSTGSPAAIALRGCDFVGYLSRIELELPESQTGVQATTPGVPCEEWWEGETAHGHRPS